MKLLVLSNYFTPDLSAGSFRMQALVDAFEPWRKKGLEVDLITTRPNRYASLKAEAPELEDHGWLRIHRLEIPAHKSGMSDQARAYTGYARGVRRIARQQSWDAVFATSSRLMTAGLGAHIAKWLDVPLYLDIRDIFTDNMDELLAGSPLKSLMPAIRLIERRAFCSASKISVVSEGFVSHMKAIAPKVPVEVFTNGIDAVFSETTFDKTGEDRDLPLIVYAGNMGEGQGLHRIVPQVAKRLSGKARFRLIGDGGRRAALEEALARTSALNVEILPPVPREELLLHYEQADILFLHLNDLEAFQKVLPSKMFEYGATGKPILAGVAGYPAQFVAENLPDAAVFAPLDEQAMSDAVNRTINNPARSERTEFRKEFDRSRIMKHLAADIVDVVGAHRTKSA